MKTKSCWNCKHFISEDWGDGWIDPKVEMNYCSQGNYEFIDEDSQAIEYASNCDQFGERVKNQKLNQVFDLKKGKAIA